MGWCQLTFWLDHRYTKLGDAIQPLTFVFSLLYHQTPIVVIRNKNNFSLVQGQSDFAFCDDRQACKRKFLERLQLSS